MDDGTRTQLDRSFSKRLDRLERRASLYAFVISVAVVSLMVVVVEWFGFGALVMGVIPTALIWLAWRTAVLRR